MVAALPRGYSYRANYFYLVGGELVEGEVQSSMSMDECKTTCVNDRQREGACIKNDTNVIFSPYPS
jgi:hypothetical protein